jgi:hypothetical protein
LDWFKSVFTFPIVVGGSLSYGANFCTRHDSDLDLIGVVPEDQEILEVVDSLRPFFLPESIPTPTEEYDAFTIKGQNLHEWVEISIHIMHASTFGKLVNPQEGCDLVLRDAKCGFPHKACNQPNFSGANGEFIPESKGGVWSMPGYFFREGRFHPGIYLNILSPGFWVENDDYGVSNFTFNLITHTMILGKLEPWVILTLF